MNPIQRLNAATPFLRDVPNSRVAPEWYRLLTSIVQVVGGNSSGGGGGFIGDIQLSEAISEADDLSDFIPGLLSRMSDQERLSWLSESIQSPQDMLMQYLNADPLFVNSVNVNGSGILGFSGGPVTSAGVINANWAGTSGGIPYFSSASALSSSGTLSSNAMMLGGGIGASPSTPVGLGTISTVLHGNASGAPSWGSVSLTADVSGVLPLSNGGTNANLTASNGGIFYSTISAAAILAGTATANQILLSGASGSPSWSTATYPTVGGSSGNVLRSNGTNFLSAQLSASDLSNGVSGSGAVILQTGPSLTAPNIGVASGTSVSLTAASTINANSGALPAPPASSLLQIGNADGTTTQITLDAFATNVAFTGRRANTSNASKSALASGNTITRLGAIGYGTTGYGSTQGAIDIQAAGTWTDADQSTQILLRTTPSGSTTMGTVGTVGSDGSLLMTGSIKSSSPTAGNGYSAGAGGTASQATSKSTVVTLNKVCGDITMFGSALAAGAKVSFVVNNSTVSSTDLPTVAIVSGGTANAYRAEVTAVASGSFTVMVENTTAGSLSESPLVRFSIEKVVTS